MESPTPSPFAFRLTAPHPYVPNVLRLPFGTCRLGRSRTCELVVKDSSISRQHATVTVEDNGLRIRDLGSHNGIYVDEARIEEALVYVGHYVKFGGISFQVVMANQEADESNQETTSVARPVNVLEEWPLTPAQRRVAELLAEGLSEKEIASKLLISKHTVHNHVREIYRVVQVHSHPEFVARLLRGQR